MYSLFIIGNTIEKAIKCCEKDVKKRYKTLKLFSFDILVI